MTVSSLKFTGPWVWRPAIQTYTEKATTTIILTWGNRDLIISFARRRL